MKNKKIAIIGASYLQLPLVKKAKEMGLETHCFAWEDGAVCREISDYFYPVSILDKEAINKICADVKIDGITTIATDMAVPTICYVAEKLGLVSNSYDSSLNTTNKGLMRKILLKNSLNSPKFLEVDTSLSPPFSEFNLPLIVKPVDRSGSRGVLKVDKNEDLTPAINFAIGESFIKKCIIEEYIEGEEISVESISWKGKHYILAVTDKITTGSPYFVELAHHQPSNLPDDLIEIIKNETIKALDALEIQHGASHSEFRITGDGTPYIIEVGARMGGDFIGSHLTELSTGYDFLKGVIDVAMGNFKGVELNKKRWSSGVFFLCEETKAILPYFTRLTDFIVESEVQTELLRPVQNSNDRSGYLIYKSENRINLI